MIFKLFGMTDSFNNLTDQGEKMSKESMEQDQPAIARRIAGVSAITFAAGVFIANGAIAGGPMADWEAAEAATWFVANEGRLMVANAMVGLTFPALVALAASMVELGRSSERSRLWMLVGALGSVCMVAIFGLLVAGNIAAVHLAGSVELFEVAWRLHFAAFAINMTALGITFFGFSMGAHAAGLIPAWQRSVGVVGAVLLLGTGIANTAVAGGSLAVAPGGIGFLLWLLWLLATGIRMLRSRAADTPRTA